MKELSITDLELETTRGLLQDNHLVQAVFHKFFNNLPDRLVDIVPERNQETWQYPDCWLSRYFCYYVANLKYLQNAHILDLGSAFNFYSSWALLNGASSSVCLEPEQTRFKLGQEYAALRGLDDKIKTFCVPLSDLSTWYGNQNERFNVVFCLDVFYYLTNGMDVLSLIKHEINPDYIFFETTVAPDVAEYPLGGFAVVNVSTETHKIQSFSNDQSQTTKLALKPSRLALKNIFDSLGLDIVNFYDYKNFGGRGESPPRREGNKVFYLLKNCK